MRCLEVLFDSFCDWFVNTRFTHVSLFTWKPFAVGNSNSGFPCLIPYFKACGLKGFIETILHINSLNQGFRLKNNSFV